jgi:hypothetical protein
VEGEFNPCVVTHSVVQQFAVDFVIPICIFEDGFGRTHFEIIICFTYV